jgi:hypothetical protein
MTAQMMAAWRVVNGVLEKKNVSSDERQLPELVEGLMYWLANIVRNLWVKQRCGLNLFIATNEMKMLRWFFSVFFLFFIKARSAVIPLSTIVRIQLLFTKQFMKILRAFFRLGVIQRQKANLSSIVSNLWVKQRCELNKFIVINDEVEMDARVFISNNWCGGESKTAERPKERESVRDRA